jgi:hypothetical protein
MDDYDVFLMVNMTNHEAVFSPVLFKAISNKDI